MTEMDLRVSKNCSSATCKCLFTICVRKMCSSTYTLYLHKNEFFFLQFTCSLVCFPSAYTLTSEGEDKTPYQRTANNNDICSRTFIILLIIWSVVLMSIIRQR